jgi:hypothetical protein
VVAIRTGQAESARKSEIPESSVGSKRVQHVRQYVGALYEILHCGWVILDSDGSTASDTMDVYPQPNTGPSLILVSPRTKPRLGARRMCADEVRS